MRIALVCPYAWDRVGGVQSHVRALAAVLRRRGHEVLVIAPRSATHRGAAPDGVAFAGRAAPVPANGSIAPVAFGPGAVASLRAALRSFDPELLHLHEPLIPSLSLIALTTSDVPAVGTFHASAAASLGYKIAAPVLERAADGLRVRTAVSDAARAFAQRYFPGDYVLTPNGVEVARFTGALPADLGPRPVILFLSRLERRKGAEVLIQAMAGLRELDVDLLVAGEGPERRRLEDLARRLDVRVTFRGFVPDAELPSLYAGATVYCAPAIKGESFGIVLVEAMAAGAPVVASDLDGFRAVAANAGVLVPPGDPGALAHALREVVTDAARRKEMRTMGVRLASLYDWERLAANVEATYGRALAAAAGAR